MRYIGIDPGLGGAIACIYDDDGRHSLYDMPVLTFKKGKGMRREYDAQALFMLIGTLIDSNRMQCHVMIEQQLLMPQNGKQAYYRAGYGFGIIVGVVTCLAVPYTIKHPQVWKKAMGVTADKESSRYRAKQLFPSADLSLKKDDGKAEALLLAFYAKTHLNGDKRG